MEQQERVSKLINWFVKAAVRHAEAIESMDEEGAMVQVHELDRFYAAIRREGGLESFLVLLESDDAAVAGMAAVYAMRQAPNRCAFTLSKIAQLPGLMGFRAQVALERWESGEWPNQQESNRYTDKA